MAIHIEGNMTADGARLAIVVARFNEFITNKLLEGALDAIRRHGGDTDKVTVVFVPGSFEAPLAAKKLAESKKYDAVICLGCVIRGQTSHFDHVAGQAAAGIAQAMMQSGPAVVFGILTADTLEQAIDRTGGKMGNTGSKAALTAIEMVNVLKKL